MTAILKVDTIQDTAGNNIINESSDTITIGASGDTTNIVGTLQNNGSALISGITMADQWRLTANLTNVTSQFITANLEQIDSSGQGTIGTAMSESSGVFTFPSTGIYLVGFSLYVYASVSDGFVDAEIHVTTNNSAYAEVANATAGIFTNGSATVGNSSLAQTLIDVTNTSNVKVKFYVDTLNTGTQVTGSTSATKTGFTFIRLGDT